MLGTRLDHLIDQVIVLPQNPRRAHLCRRQPVVGDRATACVGDDRQVSFVTGGVGIWVAPPCRDDADGVGVEADEGPETGSPIEQRELGAVAIDLGGAEVGGGLDEGWRALEGVGGVGGALEEADCEVSVGVGGRIRVGEI